MLSLMRFIDQKGLVVFILILSDAFWYFMSFLVAYFIRNDLGASPIQPLEIYLRVIPFVLILVIIVFYLSGLYEQKQRINQISEIYQLTKAVTFTLILIMAASFLQKYDYSRGLVLTFWVTSLFFINFGRYLVRAVRKYLFKKGYGIIRILIIGAGRTGRKLASEIEAYRDFGYYIVGFLDDRTKPRKSRYKFLGQTQHLLEVIKKRQIHQVFIADPAVSHEDILDIIQRCEKLPIKIKVVSNIFEIITGGINIREIEGIPSIDLGKERANIFYLFFKRFLDLILSLVGLIVAFPFLLIAALAIKFDSKGPVLFAQKRIGRRGKPFKLYKLRTMHQKAATDTYSPRSKKDPRITPVGRILRKFSLDEFPQLWNVLKGEMSIVGPRPEMPFIAEKYTEWQKRRLDVKPGITGLWQVLGRKNLPLEENLEYDFYYIQNRSFLLDLVIIFKTVFVVLTGKGAY